jgi:hypothetical protein
VGCTGVDEKEVRRLLAIELRSAVRADDDPATNPATVRVQVTCSVERSEIAVDDALTGKRLQRTIELSTTVPTARARLLALAASELVSASWIELDVEPRAAVPGLGTPPRKAARQIVASVLEGRRRPEPERLRLLATGALQALFTGAGALWGGGLRLGRDEAHHLGWTVDVQAVHGSWSQAVGSISIDALSVGAGLWLHHSWSRWSFRGGPGLRGGAVRMSGNPADPRVLIGQTFWGPWLGPEATVAFDVVITRRFMVGIAVDVGYVVVETQARANGTPAVGMDGPWLGAQVGIGIFP